MESLIIDQLRSREAQSLLGKLCIPNIFNFTYHVSQNSAAYDDIMIVEQRPISIDENLDIDQLDCL